MTGDELQKLIEPTIERLGYELTDLEVRLSGNGGLLRLTIDKADGIDLDDCEKVSNAVSALLDVEDPVPGNYSLEVSSPGVDQPLKLHRQYVKNIGKELKVLLNDGITKTGELTSVSETVIEINEQTEGLEKIEFDQIKRSTVVIKL